MKLYANYEPLGVWYPLVWRFFVQVAVGVVICILLLVRFRDNMSNLNRATAPTGRVVNKNRFYTTKTI
jgi:hypothetical protein